MVLVPTMHVGCSNDAAEFKYKTGKVLVPTMHVGCSLKQASSQKMRWVLVPTMHVGCSMILGISLQNTLEF